MANHSSVAKRMVEVGAVVRLMSLVAMVVPSAMFVGDKR